MNASKSIIVGLVLLALGLGGCATTVNVALKDEYAAPYVGVKTDWYIITCPSEVAGPAHFGKIIFLVYPLALIDLPLSMIGDTITLPYTLQGKPKDKKMECPA